MAIRFENLLRKSLVNLTSPTFSKIVDPFKKVGYYL